MKARFFSSSRLSFLEPSLSRASVLDCASPLALFEGADASESARGLAQSRTLARVHCPDARPMLEVFV